MTYAIDQSLPSLSVLCKNSSAASRQYTSINSLLLFSVNSFYLPKPLLFHTILNMTNMLKFVLKRTFSFYYSTPDVYILMFGWQRKPMKLLMWSWNTFYYWTFYINKHITHNIVIWKPLLCCQLWKKISIYCVECWADIIWKLIHWN